jgi:hypothetical protein
VDQVSLPRLSPEETQRAVPQRRVGPDVKQAADVGESRKPAAPDAGQQESGGAPAGGTQAEKADESAAQVQKTTTDAKSAGAGE